MGGTAYIDRKDAELRLDGRALAVYIHGERDGTIPLTPIDRLVLVGQLTLHTGVLHRLAEEDIAVVLLSGKRQSFRGRLVGRLHRHGRLRVAQYRQSLGPLAMQLAREWIGRKVEGHVTVLRDIAERRVSVRLAVRRARDVLEKLDEPISTANSMDRLRGLEGAAAAAYFQALPSAFPDSLGFAGRNRRPPMDPVNALLSLTYTLVHWEWVRECEMIGLDPVIGFFHEFEYGRESLACDLMEFDRPWIDRWVWELFAERTFSARDFSSEQERPGCYLKKASRSRYYQAYEVWMAPRRSRMRQEVEHLARRLLDGEDPLSVRESQAPDSP